MRLSRLSIGALLAAAGLAGVPLLPARFPGAASRARNYQPKRSRYTGAMLREIRAHGQARECARRRRGTARAAA